jgi:hypothetical protein
MTKKPRDKLIRKIIKITEKNLTAALVSQPRIFNVAGTPEDSYILRFKLFSDKIKRYQFTGFVRIKDSLENEIREFFGEEYSQVKEDIKKYISINSRKNKIK